MGSILMFGTNASAEELVQRKKTTPEDTKFASIYSESPEQMLTRRASKKVTITKNFSVNSRIPNDYYYTWNGYSGLLIYQGKTKGDSGKTWWVDYYGTIYN